MYDTNRKSRKNKITSSFLLSGFTMIELLVAIVILFGMFAFTFSNYRAYAQQHNLKGAVREFKADLRFAQEQSLAGKKPDGNCTAAGSFLIGYRVNIIDDGAGSDHQYTVTAVCSGGEDLVATKDLWPKYKSVYFGSLQSATFLNLGKGAVPPAANFTITDGVSTVNIQVTRNGKIL